MTEGWINWWRTRGDDRLSLLLWALWNPIGPVPLDEYENYTGQVVNVLNATHEADRQLLAPGAEPDDSVQQRRNPMYAASVAELAALLGRLRQDQLGTPPDDDADRRAAETLLDWYEWEMQLLG